MFASKDTLLTRPSGYQIQRSLRFRSSASGNLSRTPSTSNRKTWTYSGWVKRGAVGVNGRLLGVYGTTDSTYIEFGFSSSDTLAFGYYSGNWRITSQVFRDPSAWYHITLAFDTTQATAANRVKLYVNGVEVTAFGTNNNPTQNSDWAVNNNQAHHLFQNGNSGNYFDGYATEINFIDGQALTPSSFGAINPVTGVWSATKYAGTYGTNGFYLNFTDNSAATAAAIGKDYSGNGNNWTPNNISVTAGTTYDSMLDAPLGAGGGERGNYAVMNPLDNSGATISNGNLQVAANTGTFQTVRSGFVLPTGSWYVEVTATTGTGNGNSGLGIALQSEVLSNISGASNFLGSSSTSWGYASNGNVYNSNSIITATGVSWAAGSVIGITFDGSTLKFYKNNVLVTTVSSIPAGDYCIASSFYSSDACAFNFGQRPFSYTPPSGFKALHTGNLAAPVIALPAQNMAATTYTGNGTTQSIVNTVNGVSFQPNLAWVKSRNTLEAQIWIDSVRGVGQELESNSTNAETYNANSITSFNSNGYTSGNSNTNVATRTYVAWQWKAGGTAVTNTAGSITSSVSANTTAGFSVVTYTGTGANATVGHGLGVAPSMIIVKRRNSTGSWDTYHVSVGNTKALFLNQTAAENTDVGYWNNTTPTSSVFTVGTGTEVNQSTGTYVAYCFAPVAGYSAFGSYTGNGSADGPFLYLGFKPRFVMVKRTDSANNWVIYDTARDTFNKTSKYLYAQSSQAEVNDTVDYIDILSNGFKPRATWSALNASGGTYIYMAFAEVPFKSALGR